MTFRIPKGTKGKTMTYRDSITIAAQHAQDWDVPEELLPLTISNEAAMLCGLESDRMGCAGWD